MKTLSVKAHPLRSVRLEGWSEHISGKWHYRDLAAAPKWRHGWISFDAVTFNPYNNSVYCGLNSLDGDLLYRFDVNSLKFEGLNTQMWTDPFDSKIHRTLLLNPIDRCFYFATSLLHDVDLQHDAPGGKLVRYDWKNREYTVLTIPYPHLYVQSIAMDCEREIIYGFTYPAEFVFRYDIRTNVTRILAYVGNSLMLAQPHNAVVDRMGWLWGTYAETRAWDEVPGKNPIRLFKYHPDVNKFVWLDEGLPRRTSPDQLTPDPISINLAMPDMTESRHKQDHGFCDSMVYDGDRYIYAGTVAGVLSRIDTETDAVQKIATVIQQGRFPALSIGGDGIVYGGGGMRSKATLCRLNPGTLELDVWDDLFDESTGEFPARIHELCIGNHNVIYFAENDNHTRSSYLWSAKLPEKPNSSLGNEP